MSETKSPTAKIWEAITKGEIDQVRDLFAQHPSQIDTYIPFGGGTFLHLAASKSNVDMVSALMDIGFSLDKGGKLEGDTALVAACSYGNCPVAKFLLDKGATMDVSTAARNPLFGAIIGRSVDIVQLLLHGGIDSSVRYTSESMNDMDAIAFALERGERDIAMAIAGWIAKGDIAKAEELLAKGMEVAIGNSQAAN